MLDWELIIALGKTKWVNKINKTWNIDNYNVNHDNYRFNIDRYRAKNAQC